MIWASPAMRSSASVSSRTVPYPITLWKEKVHLHGLLSWGTSRTSCSNSKQTVGFAVINSIFLPSRAVWK